MNSVPQTGTIDDFDVYLDNVRIDTGIQSESQITPYYDSLIAKFIASGHDRNAAIDTLLEALDDSVTLGVINNSEYLRDVISTPAFRKAKLSTHFLERHMADWKLDKGDIEIPLAAAAIAYLYKPDAYDYPERHRSPWTSLESWRLWRNAGYSGRTRLVFDDDEQRRHVLSIGNRGDLYDVEIDERIKACASGHRTLRAPSDAVAHA